MADRFPFLGAGKKHGRGAGGGAGGDLADRKARPGLVDIGAGVVAHHRGEGLARRGDQRCHPVLVGEADPAVGGNLDRAGRHALALGDVEIGQVLVFQLLERAVGLAHDAFVQDVEILGIGLAMARHHAVGRDAHRRAGSILDGLGDAEHVAVIDGDLAAKDQTRAIVPADGDRLAGGQRGAGVDLPQGAGIRDQARIHALRRRPAIDRVIGFRGIEFGTADRSQQPDQRRARVKRLAVGFQRQIVDPPADERDRAGQFRRVDGDARGCRDLGRAGAVGG